ncbi:MAG: S-layer homology domain-containing protein, partial [Micrococcales bacterium]|nr:S-layer homology domain-containing protein [Micrococcales bacterium]
NGNLTRAMIVTTLYRIENSPATTGLPNPFNDVAEGAWYADAIIWAAAEGIVIGYGDGRFGPDDPATLEQLATIIDRYASFTGAALPEQREYTGFNDDADIAEYAKAAVVRLYQAAIIEGKPGNILAPRGNATRAEFAAMLRRYMMQSSINSGG